MLTDENLDKIEQLLKIADRLNISLSVLSLAWALRKSCVSSLITGASTPNQLQQNLPASGLKLSDNVLNEIEGILNFHPFCRRIG